MLGLKEFDHGHRLHNIADWCSAIGHGHLDRHRAFTNGHLDLGAFGLRDRLKHFNYLMDVQTTLLLLLHSVIYASHFLKLIMRQNLNLQS